MPHDTEQIRREVRRLSPWYYAFNLAGVRTDETPPCDPTGHRRIFVPQVRPGFWTGKRVLDVACAEGAFGFGELAHGAAFVRAFDCRQTHVDKARLVASVLGYGADRVQFELGSCDQWPDQHPTEVFDHVFLCGIIYHLTAPWQTIARYCQIARDSILVSGPLHDGATLGWTLWQEGDNIAASENSVDSFMANSIDTYIQEFAKHGFVPTHVAETSHPVFRLGCNMLFSNTRAVQVAVKTAPPKDDGRIDVHALWRDDSLLIALYNRCARPRTVTGHLVLRDAKGGVLADPGPQTLQFAARFRTKDDAVSTSHEFVVPIPAGTRRDSIEVQVRLIEGSEVVGGVHCVMHKRAV